VAARERCDRPRDATNGGSTKPRRVGREVGCGVDPALWTGVVLTGVVLTGVVLTGLVLTGSA
jgi:hypothetical protein